jgi:hypothetical protein
MPEWLEKPFAFVLVALGFGGSGLVVSALTQDLGLVWVCVGAIMILAAGAMLRWAARYEHSILGS